MGLTAPESLSGEDAALAEQVGARLRSNLSTLIRAMESEARSVREMAEYLGIDRNLCQRVASAAKVDGDAREVLMRAPGTRGLSIFVEAFRAKGDPVGHAEPAQAAVEAFESLIHGLAGSQTKLVARLKASLRNVSEPIPADEAALARRTRFEADVQLMGISARTHSVLDVYRPMAHDPADPSQALFEGFQASAWERIRSHHRGVPFIQRMIVNPNDGTAVRPSTIDREPHAAHPSGYFLAPFCSDPLPTYTQKGGGESTTGIFDLDLEPGGPALDLGSGRLLSPAGTLPALTSDPVILRRVTPRYPTRCLILDVLLHRSLASSSVASLGAYIPVTSRSLALHERWFDRVPNPPRLEVYDPASGGASSPVWSRQAEFVLYTLERLGWSPAEFVGYRCEVQHPLIGVAYILNFDFRTGLESSE
jgi:hypothetical protein